MGFFVKFHLVIIYKKGGTNKLVDMILRPPTSNIKTFGTLMHMDPLMHDAHKDAYIEDGDFK